MRFLFIGDIVGKPGIDIVKAVVPRLRIERSLDFVVANAENATNGSGCLPSAYRAIRAAGVDLVTLGDHVYRKSDIIKVLMSEADVCKPANLPATAPGREYACCTLADGTRVAAFCLLGRTFMRPADDPFVAADRVLAQLAGQADVIIVDAHAEATADKYALGHHLAGRVTAVLGTHTHIPTADEQLLPGGTAFICDVGMTGPYDSILGRRTDRVLHHARTCLPTPFDVAEGDVRLGGAIVEFDRETGRATAIERLCVREAVSEV